jgi:hypothetical protein
MRRESGELCSSSKKPLPTLFSCNSDSSGRAPTLPAFRARWKARRKAANPDGGKTAPTGSSRLASAARSHRERGECSQRIAIERSSTRR